VTYDEFKLAVQARMRFWFGRTRDDDVVEVNCREAYALGMRVDQTAHDIAFGALPEQVS
jgi:hypothetical protein